jgi:inhibitor of cysteine peptidase
MRPNKIIIGLSIFALLSMILIGCTEQSGPRPGTTKPITETIPKTGTTATKTQTENAATEELKKFSSASELMEFLDKAQKSQGYASNYGGAMQMTGSREMMVKSSSDAISAIAPSAESGGAADYSQTNVQVKGVDEADIVKNDNKYIYTIVQDKLVIVDAYPAAKSKILSETELEGRPVNMFVNEDRLVIFLQADDQAYMIPEYGYMPIPRYTMATRAIIYDIKDRENPKKLEKLTVKGNYYQARMIGDYVYFITQEGVYYYNNFVDMPVVKMESGKTVSPDVYYFDRPDMNYQFNTIASFNIKNPEITAKTFMMGYANTLYVSKANIYIAYQKSSPWNYYRQNDEERFYAVVVPMLPSETRTEIDRIQKDAGMNSYEKWDKISSQLEDLYNKMDENDKDDLIEKIDEATSEYDIKQEVERRKTVIHKISIDNGAIEYAAKGEVSGYLLNQFSMDEYKENLRVATTTEIWVPKGSEMYNNVYILDSKMGLTGKLEDIAPDEKIYSTRFLGERLYMVTFKRIDPLFVIDLANPANPKILGKLKIPGYSDYLQAYDENHIIGIGKETESNEWGGVSTGGVKLALFDVSDVANPKEIDHYEIGEAGSDSEALRDHKAFLFDKEKNVLVIPVREVKGTRYYSSRYGYYSQRVWQGAYVFGVDPNTGFEKRGKITHLDGDEDEQYWYNSPSAVRRTLYMDDVLYTVSATKIKMNDIKSVEDISEIELPYRKDRYYDYPWWY